MDDWLSVLLFLIFIVFPLLEALVGRKKKRTPQQPRKRQPREWEWEPLPDLEPAERGKAPELPPARREPVPSGGWSEGWGAWPVEVADDETEDESLEDETLEGATIEADTREVIVPEPVPARPESATRVVSLEPVEIDRKAQHRRFHDRYVTPPVAPTRPPRRTPAVSPLLRGSADVRRAIILAEVLGPPRALRPSGPDLQPGL